jgi:membrane protein
MKLSGKKILRLLKDSYKEFSQDDTFTLGAALSYYTVFSLAPILIIAIAVAGMIFGREAVTGQVYAQMKGFLGSQGADQVQEMIKAAYKPGQSTIATILAIAALIFGATTVFNQLQMSLNKIWEVKPKPKKSYIKYIKNRFLSFGLILGVGFLLLVSLVLNAALVGLSGYLNQVIHGISAVVLNIIENVLSLGMATLLFAMIYKYLPDAKVRWRDVWIGSLFTALLFTLGKFLIGLYIGKTAVGSTYGAAGSIIVVLVWVNYSAQILFFGAEFTQVYAREFGSRIQPTPYAVRLKTVEVEQADHESPEEYEAKVKKVQKSCEIPKPQSSDQNRKESTGKA